MALPTGKTIIHAGRAFLYTSRIQRPSLYATSLSRAAAAPAIRSGSFQRTFATTSPHLHNNGAQTQTPAPQHSNSDIDGSENGAGKDEGEGAAEQKNLPLSPYGGRFGVLEQPMSTKSIALAQASLKRSPFAKAKDGMKSKVSDWTDKEKNLEKRKEL